MENNITTAELYGEDSTMQFTPEIKNSIFKISKWARIVGMAGMVFTLISALPILFMGSAFPTLPEGMETGIFFNVIMFVILAFGFYLMYLLFNFASKMMVALKNDDEELVLIAFENLRKHYTIYGIVMLVYIGFFALMVIFTLLFGAFAL